jgi:dihydroneopterin aldolase
VTESAVTVEVRRLSLYTNLGVSAAERQVGQRLLVDVAFELESCAATLTDSVDDTVDYGDVCEQVAFAVQGREYKTLERVCEVIAERLMERYGVDSVRVRAAKPEPPIPLPVEEVAVEVWRTTGDLTADD